MFVKSEIHEKKLKTIEYGVLLFIQSELCVKGMMKSFDFCFFERWLLLTHKF
jgi:hypothetical protein